MNQRSSPEAQATTELALSRTNLAGEIRGVFAGASPLARDLRPFGPGLLRLTPFAGNSYYPGRVFSIEWTPRLDQRKSLRERSVDGEATCRTREMLTNLWAMFALAKG